MSQYQSHQQHRPPPDSSFPKDFSAPRQSFREREMQKGDSQHGPRSTGETAKVYKFPTENRQFFYDGDLFCSRSEAACAAIMKRLLGYKLIDGKTFQFCIGENERGAKLFADYVVRGVIFEYHPIQKPHDPQYWKLLSRTPPGKRQEFRDSWNRNEAVRYHDKRQSQIDSNPKLAGTELIVAQSPQEFYHLVIKRFMEKDYPNEPWMLPTEAQVVSEFRKIQGQVRELGANKGARHIRVRQPWERRAA